MSQLCKAANLKLFWKINVEAVSLLFHRSLLSAQAAFKNLTFAEVQKELQGKDTVLLDVREKGELTTDGKIPRQTGSNINVPVGNVTEAFQLDNGAFEAKFGFSKPSKIQNIVVHCKAGIRAQSAAKALSQLGYSNIKVYPGINDWIENGGPLTKK